MDRPLEPEDLTPRQLEVLLLVGRDGLRYKEAARRLPNLNAWGKMRRAGVTVSWRTVKHYATEIRDLSGRDGDPKAVLKDLYYEWREELEEAA